MKCVPLNQNICYMYYNLISITVYGSRDRILPWGYSLYFLINDAKCCETSPQTQIAEYNVNSSGADDGNTRPPLAKPHHILIIIIVSRKDCFPMD